MIYSAAAAAVTLWLLGGMAVGRMRRRRRRGRDAVLQRKYLHIVMLALFSGGEETPRFPLLRRAGARRLLIETVGRLVAATYGLTRRRCAASSCSTGWTGGCCAGYASRRVPPCALPDCSPGCPPETASAPKPPAICAAATVTCASTP
ncbi:MAG: hypothetical protein ACLRM8_01970 [Alistipes sp.]